MERGDITIVLRCIPLLDRGRVDGAVVLLRDISELRSRDRLLVSKDATIKEIHHRVKNNLQTISSLLRLQGRRLTEPSAKAAIEESVRRIRSIALVHETLSREDGDEVDFGEIVRPLVRMVEEGLTSPDRPVGFAIAGDAGKLPSTDGDVAGGGAHRTAAERRGPRLPGRHARRGRDGPGAASSCRPRAGQLASWWSTTAWASGRTFDPEQTASLGLSIVRGLVAELDGTITFPPAVADPLRVGARAPGCALAIPVGARPGAGRARPPGAGGRSGVGSIGGRRCRSRTPRAQDAAAARRCWATHARRSLRRSSSEVPPQTPESWLVVEGELQAGLLGLAGVTHGLGRGDLLEGRAGGAHGEEQVRVGVTTDDGLASRRLRCQAAARGQRHGVLRGMVGTRRLLRPMLVSGRILGSAVPRAGAGNL